jgi:hypothetical protein
MERIQRDETPRLGVSEGVKKGYPDKNPPEYFLR